MTEKQFNVILKTVIKELKIRDKIRLNPDSFGFYFNKKSLLDEGLIKTYPATSLINMLKKQGIEKYGINGRILKKEIDNKILYQIYFSFRNGFANIPIPIIKDFFSQNRSIWMVCIISIIR